MKITKNSYDKELQGYYAPLKVFSDMLTRKWSVNLMNFFMGFMKGKNIEGLKCEQRYIPSKSGGPDIRIRIFRPENAEGPLPALLYNHGGGYMLGVPELSLGEMENYIKKRPCVVVAPDYRKSIKHPFPEGFNDCYDTLLWMKENASSLNIRSDKFMVGGHSAGGGLTAAVSLKACDTGDVDIAFQMPIYPMIDCRQNTESAIAMDEGVPCWNTKSNAFGWKMYLQNVQGDVPKYASAILSEKFNHLPPTITFVGDLEPFKDETINYVEELRKEGIPVKFEVFEKAYHGFETLVQDAAVAKKANDFQFNAFAEYYDTYVKN